MERGKKMRAGCIGSALLCCVVCGVSAQSFEAQQLLLDWQKLLQEKQLLSDLYNGYEILSKGYAAIRDISKGSYDLHKAWLDGLLSVSPAVRNYQRVADIINLQEKIIAGYTSAWAKFRQDLHFSPDELAVIGNIYSGLFDDAGRVLSTLTTILTDGEWRASDAERLQEIDGLYREMVEMESRLISFNNRTALLSLQRSADENEFRWLRQWYGLTF